MLSRDDFEKSCKAFLDKYACSDDDIHEGWSWREHAYLPRLGYLVRKRTARSSMDVHGEDNDGDAVEETETDTATAATPAESELVEVCQFVVYSPTFQVPAFYFSMHRRSGSPLSLNDILASSLFRRNAFGNAQKTSFALQAPEHAFPLLSQGEHPTLGTPCWVFHPCETPTALAELMEADGNADASSARMLELWLLLVGNVINLRG